MDAGARRAHGEVRMKMIGQRDVNGIYHAAAQTIFVFLVIESVLDVVTSGEAA